MKTRWIASALIVLLACASFAAPRNIAKRHRIAATDEHSPSQPCGIEFLGWSWSTATFSDGSEAYRSWTRWEDCDGRVTYIEQPPTFYCPDGDDAPCMARDTYGR